MKKKVFLMMGILLVVLAFVLLVSERRNLIKSETEDSVDLSQIMSDLISYEILEIETSADQQQNAVATLEVTMPDMKKVMENSIEENLDSDLDYDELLLRVEKEVVKKLKGTNCPMKKTTIDTEVIMNNDKWTIADEDELFGIIIEDFGTILQESFEEESGDE